MHMTITDDFSALGLSEQMLEAVRAKGFETPTAIQKLTIPHLLTKPNDIIAQSQTGTGKTAAYGLPILQTLEPARGPIQAIILVPTRELALQAAEELLSYNREKRLSITAIYGGAAMSEQLRRLAKGIDIVVGTPGRVLDHIRRGTMKLENVRYLVLDEADEMLNMGFVDSINEILEHVPSDRKMLMFSATMPAEIAKIAKRFMHDPVEFVVGTRNEGAANVRHIYYMVHARDKYLALKRIADNSPNIYAIIFCRTRRDTQEVAENLIRDGYNADALHGDLSQQQRDMVMKKFRDRVVTLLVATDVAARGLDVDDLTHVINYGLPEDTAVYTHRSGRTGRAGKTGVSIAIIHSRERGKLREIERIIGKTFERKEVPTPDHIIEKQLFWLADRLERVEVNDEEIGRFIPGVAKKLGWLSNEDLLKRVLSLEFNRLLEYYKDAPQIDFIDEKPRKERKERSDAPVTKEEKDRRTASKGMERIYVNAGKRDGFYAGNLIEMLNKVVGGKRVDVGRIDLMPGYSLFDVKKSDARRVVGALKGADFMGKRIYSEIASPDKDYAKASVRRTKDKYVDAPFEAEDAYDAFEKFKRRQRRKAR